MSDTMRCTSEWLGSLTFMSDTMHSTERSKVPICAFSCKTDSR